MEQACVGDGGEERAEGDGQASVRERLRYVAAGMGIAAALGGAVAPVAYVAYQEASEARDARTIEVDGYSLRLPADAEAYTGASPLGALLMERYGSREHKAMREDMRMVRGELLVEVRAQAPALASGGLSMDEAYDGAVDGFIAHHQSDPNMQQGIAELREHRNDPDVKGYLMSELAFGAYLAGLYAALPEEEAAACAQYYEDDAACARLLAGHGDVATYSSLSEAKARSASKLVDRVVREVGFPLGGMIRRPLTDVFVTEPRAQEQHVAALAVELDA